MKDRVDARTCAARMSDSTAAHGSNRNDKRELRCTGFRQLLQAECEGQRLDAGSYIVIEEQDGHDNASGITEKNAGRTRNGVCSLRFPALCRSRWFLLSLLVKPSSALLAWPTGRLESIC
jgi:hypothetical protein